MLKKSHVAYNRIQTTYNREMNCNSEGSVMPGSCPKLSEVESDCMSKPSQTSSLPTSLTDMTSINREESNNSTVTARSETSVKLVQNCSPDCMITQKIVDRLLARMLHLENERTELLAANRSWAIQFEMMKESHKDQVKKLESKVQEVKREKEMMLATNQNADNSWRGSRDQVEVLTQQAEIYREDFLEERKARTRAHAQIEALRNELKRERKSRAKLSEFIEKTKEYDGTSQVLG